jgi:glycine cleavage system transcriptional repressor
VLAGEFALIVLFSGPQEALDRVQSEHETLEQEYGFTLTFKTTEQRAQIPQILGYTLEVTGVDQPGIVHRVSEVLASHQVNVTSLETRLPRAAFSGTPLFSLKAELEIPDKWILGDLHSKLEVVCEEWHLGYVLEESK